VLIAFPRNPALFGIGRKALVSWNSGKDSGWVRKATLTSLLSKAFEIVAALEWRRDHRQVSSAVGYDLARFEFGERHDVRVSC
jgi:hypothetical protein